ncbi:glycoside hydrolase family 108 protein [Ancylobacter sp. WKF20]|uniref:glycoside hydrolase family 108 protein n=1 Tax=Ancylobacter sp. WKF20 TaxID=3039801 RepID=UPI002434525E|nr:glycoside hydrolase family 108 protein [Ancylobacter sp. WKF20]WGD31273.1 glycoside hydrolase family 108 protein [Ancylobacter sp. WKF20]
MRVNFRPSLTATLKHEGGYADHPADPGGATMRGITQRVYDGYRRRRGQAPTSVRHISSAEIEDIYRLQYWDACRCDELPAGIDFCMFDGAVHSGPAQAAKWLQRTLGVRADGVIGEATLAAARAVPVGTIIDGVCDRRLAMLRTLATFRHFGAGWTRRVADVRELSRRMAAGMASTKATIDPAPPAEPGEPKALPQDRGLPDIIKSPEGIGGLVSIFSAFLTAATDPSSPLAWALAALIIAAIAGAGFYFVRRMRSADA